jgi:hypothetical protein
MPAPGRLRRALVLSSLLLMPLVALAAATVEELGFDPTQLEQSLFGAMRGWYGPPDIPAAVRAMPADQKVAVVQTLGAFAKSYVSSSTFKSDYGKAYKESKPKGFGLPSLNVEQMAKTEAQKAVQKSGPAPSSDLYKLDKNPNVQLKKALEAFLKNTENVDFTAVTKSSGGLKVFEKSEYEAKPREWKMCYRAGKETSEAIRAFASGWLDELKKEKEKK